MSLKRSLGLLVILELGGCRPGSVAVGPDHVSVPVERAAVLPVVEGAVPAIPREPASELAVVATGKEVRLVRPVNGPVLLVDAYSRAFYETTTDGVVRPFAPVGTYIAEHVKPHLSVGRIAGVWPAMTVEVVYVARTEMYSQSFSIDIAKATLKSAGRKSVMTAAMPWKDGRTLAYGMPDTNMPYDGNGKFYVASGAAAAVPKLPARAVFSGDFVAYANGSVILSADVAPPDGSEGEIDDATVFVYADAGASHPTSHKMPGPVTGMARGRVPEETLVRGERFLRRYDGAGWVDVPLPIDEDIHLLTVDDDGTAWLVAGAKLYRGALPALAWTGVRLPPDVVVTDVAATTSRDVWIVADDGRVLHRGPAPAGAPFQLADNQDDFVRMITKEQEPHAFFDGCQIPLVVLGAASDTTEAQARAVEIPPMLDGSLQRGRLGATTVYTFEPNVGLMDTATNATLRKTLSTIRKTLPKARLVCGRSRDVEAL